MNARLALLFCACTFGSVASSFAEDCEHPSSPPAYRAQPGDRSDAASFDASRSFSGVHTLEVNACRGEVRVKGTQSASLRVEITAEGAGQELSRYLQDFTVQDGSAHIDVRVPGKFHPLITVYVPEVQDLRSEINLGAGDLQFYSDRVEGKRELNVGAGRVTVFLEADRDYASLEANVGMGSFHDKRPGGDSAHFVVARSMSGRGRGSLEINVGAGSIELAPAK